MSLFRPFICHIVFLLLSVSFIFVPFSQDLILLLNALVYLNLPSFLLFNFPPLQLNLLQSLSFQFGIVLFLLVVASLLLVFDILNQTECFNWCLFDHSASVF